MDQEQVFGMLVVKGSIQAHHLGQMPIERVIVRKLRKVVPFQQLDTLKNKLCQQGFLGVEVVIKGALGQADAFGDVLDAGALETAIAEQLDSRLQQLLPGYLLFALAPPYGRSFHQTSLTRRQRDDQRSLRSRPGR